MMKFVFPAYTGAIQYRLFVVVAEIRQDASNQRGLGATSTVTNIERKIFYQLARKAPAFRPGMDSAESAGLHCGG